MSVRIVDDVSLTAVADAIRSKSGNSESLNFPNGMINAITTLQGGGETATAAPSDILLGKTALVRGKMITGTLTLPAVSIKLDLSNLNIPFGQTAKLCAVLTPANSTDPVFWSSSDPKIAEVSSSGTVTWIGTGECIVTATAGDVSASCSVLCKAEPTAVMSNFKYLGPTTYSPGSYTAWCPTGLIYDETRDVYAHFMTVRGSHYSTPDQIQIWFNTIDPETLEHTEPVFLGNGASNVTGGGGFTGTVIKNGIYYAFSKDFGYYKSADGGKTWTHCDYIVAPEGVWGCYVLPNGRMIMGDDMGEKSTFISYSDDDGATWVKVQTNDLFDEPTFIPFGGGKVMAIIRYQIASTDPLSHPYMRISEDYGETWTAPVEMQTAGYMNANNCNAFVHDGIIELFVGCRVPATNSEYLEEGGAYEGVTYAIEQYQMDLSMGMVDNFTHVARVYEYKANNNNEGLANTDTDNFSTPCIAIKAKDNGICMFYKPRRQGVTHHFIAMSNTNIASTYEIPDIKPTSYAASQTFSGSSDDVTLNIAKLVHGSTQYGDYPYMYNGAYILIDDIVDGGFVHAKFAAMDYAGADFPAFTTVADGTLLSGGRDRMQRSPIPDGSSYGFINAHADPNYKCAKGIEIDIYAFIRDDIWWMYYDKSWWRMYAGRVVIDEITDRDVSVYNISWAYAWPYKNGGLSSYKALMNFSARRHLMQFEYDKA